MSAGSEFIWNKKKRWLLWPLSALFQSIVSIRRRLYAAGWLKSHTLPVPVIVVGNLPVGGVGKTPITMALAQWLIDAGFCPGIVSRGYGRQGNDIHEVLADSNPKYCGDEPLMIKKQLHCPVVVGHDRAAAAEWLLSRYPECQIILSDDGLQHYRLHRDLELAVFDQRGAGNGQLLPMGPLREPCTRLKDVNAVLINRMNISQPLSAVQNTITAEHPVNEAPFVQVLGNDNEKWTNAVNTLCSGKKIKQPYHVLKETEKSDGTAVFNVNTTLCRFVNVLNPEKSCPLTQFQGQSAFVVTGIGNPTRFFDTLTHLGVRYQPQVFADHHAFSASDFSMTAESDLVLMTQKDAVKCQPFSKRNWWFLEIRTQLPDVFIDWLLMELTRLDCLVCPVCKGTLELDRSAQELICRADRLAYPIKEGIPVMMENQARKLDVSDSEH